MLLILTDQLCAQFVVQFLKPVSFRRKQLNIVGIDVRTSASSVASIVSTLTTSNCWPLARSESCEKPSESTVTTTSTLTWCGWSSSQAPSSAAAFLVATFLAGAFFAGAFLVAAFFAGAFFAAGFGVTGAASAGELADLWRSSVQCVLQMRQRSQQSSRSRRRSWHPRWRR